MMTKQNELNSSAQEECTTLEALEAAEEILGGNASLLDNDSTFDLSLAIKKAWEMNQGSYERYLSNYIELIDRAYAV